MVEVGNGWYRWSGAQPDGQCLPLLMFPCTIKSKFSSGTGSPGWSQKKGRKMVVVVVVLYRAAIKSAQLW